MFVVNTDKFFMSHRLSIALAAMNEGFEVHLVAGTSSCADQIRKLGLRVHSLMLQRSSMNVFSNALTFYQILRVFMRVRPDIVHLVTIKPVILGGLAARLTKVECVVSAISGLGFVYTSRDAMASARRLFISGLYRWALGNRDQKVIFQNEADRQYLIKFSGVAREKTALVKGSGVNLVEYSKAPMPQGMPIIMLAARLLIDKGVRDFVDAARYFKNNGVRARFVLVGTPDIGNPNSISEDELNRWVDENVVESWGYRNDMPDVLAKCSVFVLPSFYGEGLPKVLMEAAARGRPVVTTDHPGCRDAIIPNKTGLLIPKHDVKKLCNAIQILTNNPSLREEMGLAGRKLAEQEFDVEVIVRAHMEIYYDFLKTAR